MGQHSGHSRGQQSPEPMSRRLHITKSWAPRSIPSPILTPPRPVWGHRKRRTHVPRASSGCWPVRPCPHQAPALTHPSTHRHPHPQESTPAGLPPRLWRHQMCLPTCRRRLLAETLVSRLTHQDEGDTKSPGRAFGNGSCGVSRARCCVPTGCRFRVPPPTPPDPMTVNAGFSEVSAC